jgi:glutamate synthase (NADPH) small chain
VVVARGYIPDPFLHSSTPGLSTDERHHVIIDHASGRTSRAGVFAGGDNTHHTKLVVNAIAAGKRAARAIDQYLNGLQPGDDRPVAQLTAGATAQPSPKKKRRWFGR